MTVNEGRSRTRQSRRKQRKAAALWDPELNRWHKYAKCVICRRRFVVNNYADRKVRVSQNKIAGRIVCPWCKGRDAKFIIQLMLIAEKVAAHEMSFCHSDVADRPVEGCKCLGCVAGRVLKTHAELPTLK